MYTTEPTREEWLAIIAIKKKEEEDAKRKEDELVERVANRVIEKLKHG